MDYRSDGAIYLPDKVYFLLPNKLKEDLNDNWHQDIDNKNIWNFYDCKWYTSFDYINLWEEFMNKLDEVDEEYDFIRLGENIDDSEVRTYKMFYVDRTIVYN